jgi:hypothetical protein
VDLDDQSRRTLVVELSNSPRWSTMKDVEVVVKSTRAGTAIIVPYSHKDGLQFFRPPGVPRDLYVKYEVPAYEVYVAGVGPFRAVRFALRNLGGDQTPPERRPCDSGLSHHRVCKPTWVPNYSPHSFRGRARPGAWRLLPGQQFLIHEGPGSEPGAVGGSIGCVEILDGKWGHFLWQIEDAAGASCADIGAARKLTVTIEAAAFPLAVLRT